MATISVPSSIQGKTYSVKIAGDTPTPEEQARISAFVAQQDAQLSKFLPSAQTAAPTDEGGGVGNALGVGVDMLQQAYGSALEGAGSSLGLESLRDYGKSVADFNSQQIQEATPGLTGWEDVNGIGSGLNYFGQTLAQQVPQLGVSLAGAGAGMAIGSAVPFVGTALGGIAGGALANIPFFYGSNRERQKEADVAAGRPVEVDEAVAFLSSIPQATIDAVVDKMLVGKLLKPEMIGAGNILLRTVKGAGAGIAAEVPSEIGQQVIERAQAGLPIDSDDALAEYAAIARDTAILGGTIGSVSNVIEGDTRVKKQKEQEEEASRQIREDQEEDAKDIMAKIGLGQKSMEAPVEEAKRLTTNLLPAPTVGQQAAPEGRPVGNVAPPVVTAQPTTEAPLPGQQQRPAPSFRWKQYQAVLQNIGKEKAPTVLAIQKAAETAGSGPVTPAVARDIRAQMERDGVIAPSAKVKGGYEYQPNVTPQVDRSESYRRTIEDVTREAQDARVAREKAVQDARRAEQTGKKADARKFMLEVDKADQAIAAAERTVQEVSAQMPMAQQQEAVPTVQQPGSRMEGKQMFAPITEASPAVQATAVTSRGQRLRQAMSYYQDQARRQGLELRRLQDAQKKVQLPKSDIKKMDDLKASIAQATSNVQQIGKRLANPTADIEENVAQQKAAVAREAAAKAERAAKTPIYSQKEGEVFNALRKRLSGMGLKDVQLVAEKMLKPETAKQGALYEGLFDAKDGNRTIAVAMGIYDPSLSVQQQIDALSEVMNHEVIHALRNLGLFTEAEWKTLSDLAARQQFMKQKGGKVVQRNYTYLQRAKQMYASDTAEIQIEEAIAEMFRDYAAGRLKIGGRPKTLMDRIKGFFTSIWGAHEDVGMTDPNQIFEGVRFGEIGKRERPAENRANPANPIEVERQSRVAAQRAPSDPDFQKWASGPNGERVITDDAGNPKVFYTGTSKDQDFTSFKVGRHGGWFTADPEVASQYAAENDSMGFKQDGWKYIKTNTASRVIPAFLRAANPYTGPLPDFAMASNYKKSQSDWFDTLRRDGYDAWMPSDNPGLAVVLSDANQVKSVFARGTGGKGDMRRYSMRVAYEPELVDAVERDGRSRAITNIQPDGDTIDRISTRQPKNKRAEENPLTQNLVIDLAAMQKNPKAFAHNMQLLKSYVGFRTDHDDPNGIAEDFIRFVEGNLNWLYSMVPQEIRDKSKLWYKGARRITENWSGQFGVPDFTVAGVLAALSPQKDWYNNVSLAERVLDIHTHFTSGNNISFLPDAQMAETAARIYGGPQYAESLKKVLSNPYADLLQEEHQAMWLRIYDEAHNPRGYRVVSSEGDFIGKADGAVAWGSNSEIAKAIYVLKHQNRDATSEAMGEKHKVRNFYNNILAPDAPHGDVTIDTHAVAAALIRPLSGGSPEVYQNFGASLPTSKQPEGWSAAKPVGDTGASGTYGIYAEAYRRAADKLGILPRELQSITWEAVRGIFPAVDKRNKGKTQRVNEEWAKVSAGTQTEAEARENISRIMGGIDAPTWYGLSDPSANRRGPSSYEGELAGSRIERQLGRIGRTDVRDAGRIGSTSGRGGSSSGVVSSGRPGVAAEGPSGRAARFSVLSAGAGDGGGREQVRGLAPLEGAPQVRGASGPDMNLVRVAEDYARSIGIDLRRQAYYAKVDPERAARIAEAYDAMPHAPNDPKVKEAYRNLIDQTTAQYKALEDAGYKFWFMDPENVGEYGSSPWNAMRDLRANKSMGVYPTTGGFGSNEDADIANNPMLEETGLMWPWGGPDGRKVPVLANDLFRAVHDAFGHGLEGAGFRADGEENAWQAHIRLFTGSAKGAITSETRGQNSWLNYGPHGESNRNAKVEDTVFADQKTGIMPDWTWQEGRVPDAEAYPDVRASVRYSVTPYTKAVQQKVQSNQNALMYARSSDLIAKALNLGGRGIEATKAQRIADTILRKFQDSMIPVGRMVQELSQAGLTITDAMDPVLQEELLHGVVGDRIEQNQKQLFQPLLDAVKALNVPKAKIDALVQATDAVAAKGKGFLGLALERYGSPRLALAEAFLYARHAKERNRFILSNRDKTNANGSGMNAAEADAIINWFIGLDAANKDAITKVGQQARAIVENTNLARVDGGLISRDVSGLDPDSLEGANFRHYVPLRGKVEEESDDDFRGAPASPKFGAKGREDQQALGRFDYAADLIGNLFTQNQSSILRAERNKVGQSFLKLMRSDPQMTASYGEILKTIPKIKVPGPNATLKEVPDFRAAQDPDILVVKEDGKQTWVRFTDLSLAGALNGKNGMSPTSSNVMLKAMQKLNRYLSTINTSYNPEFIITNAFRDLQTGLLNMNQHEQEGAVRDVLGNLLKAGKGIREVIRKGDDQSEWAKVYEDYVSAGGQNVTNEFNTLSDEMANIKTMLGDISDAGMRGQWAKVKNGFVGKGVGSMIHLIEDYNTVVENTIRVSAYKALLDRGYTRQRAAQAARNLTVNFAKGGDYRQFMNAWSLFYNASLQGSFALLNAAVRSKRVQKMWLGIMAAGILQDQLNAMLSDDDDDGRKIYDKIPDHILERNFILPDFLNLTDRSYISIPMPYGLNMAHNLGRATSAALRGARDPGDTAGQIAMNIVDTVNPLGGTESFFNLIAPTVADPLVDIVENRDFADKPIYKEGLPFDKTPAPSSQQYWSTTSPSAVWISNMLNEMTGGNEVRPGFVDWSPDVLEYWFNFATGGIGRFAQSTVEGPLAVAQEGFSDETIRQLPLLRKVLGSVSSREDTGAYMEGAKRVLMAAEELKTARENGDQRWVADTIRNYGAELRLVGPIKSIEASLKKLSMQRRQVEDNRNIPDQQRRLILDRLDARKQMLLSQGNALLNRLE